MSHDLNPPQHDAVNTLSGPLLVLAGAGTGKTRVVTYRIAQLIRHGVKPQRILAVTFTNKAAAEMQQRAMALLGRRAPERPEISTFHSLCVRVLRRQIYRLGYPAKFAICDRGDQEGMARRVLREIRVASETLRPGDLLFQISRWKSQSVLPDDAQRVAASDKELLAAAGYRRYQAALQMAGAVDFDDLLLCTERIFHEFSEARLAEASRFDHLLVDEYQDTNGSQYRIVKALAGGHQNLCVVGDDDQSIYGWRGAEVSHILRFKQDWPMAKVVRLEDNYRSTAEILELANRLIKFNLQRHDKTLRAARHGGQKPTILQCKDEEDEAKQVVNDIKMQLGTPGTEPKDFAILFRTNEQPRSFEEQLRRAQLPYVLIGGMSFYDRKEVRDLLAYLRLISHPEDEVSLRRIINRPARGIGESTIKTLTAEAVKSGESLWRVMPRWREIGLSAAAGDALDRFRTMVICYHKQIAGGKLVELARNLIDDVNYKAEIEQQYKEKVEQTARLESVEEVINSLASFVRRTKEPALHDFLDELALGDRDDAREKENQLARNAIALLTLHSAKGLEFPQVYLVGMEEGLLPHHRAVAEQGTAIDEERRLCYVGVTRAQERLTLSLALSRMKWGKPRDSQPSRFLFELAGLAESAADAVRKATASRRKQVPSTVPVVATKNRQKPVKKVSAAPARALPPPTRRGR